ncbi:carboxypeptidase regulatory-like domain-containing protein [Segetibacter sp. 3557_3]|uniref:carboxypeptidase-like regulatory domain-containing protein n=1 Tax=Segetibacter sp. 3557_3 TaxID=2547429 RepID=UPI0010583C0B|nr:carboxypeptidase-like regulatory domain-containing protein [Segetibacter sp. 3557_3]TDH23019.1 carboxypeptidase regulatory-like domain-containing protein [Segetibacter sp. 3557_3]
MRFGKPMLVITAILFITTTFAQQSATSIRGSVFSGLRKMPLNEAVITLTSTNMPASRIVLSDSTGNYTINNVLPGTYTLTCEMEGYKTAGKSNVVVNDGEPVAINIEMTKGKTRDRDRTAERERIIQVSDRRGS